MTAVHGVMEQEHNQNLHELLLTAQREGPAFNSKCLIKRSSIAFFGNVCSAQGIQPDPQKVKDSWAILPPLSKSDFHHFLGLVTNLTCHQGFHYLLE